MVWDGTAVAAGPGYSLATTIQPNDLIHVTLAATKNAPGNSPKRFSIAATFDGAGYQLDAQGQRMTALPELKFNLNALNNNIGAAPTFPYTEYAQAVARGQAEGKGLAYADAVRSEFEAKKMGYDQAINGAGKTATVADVVTDAVLSWAKEAHGVQETDGDHPVVKRSEIITKTPIRSGTMPASFVVQIQPKWGR